MSQQHIGDTMDWLRVFRHRIINLLLGGVVILGAIGLIFSIVQEIRAGIGQISYILGTYIAAYLVCLFLWLNRRISNKWRAIAFLILVYAFSVFSFFSGWLAGGGRVFLLPLIVLTAILLGARSGVLVALLSLLTYTGFAIAYTQGWLSYGLAPILSDPVITLIEGIGFAMAVGMTSIGLWFFRQGLEAANQAIEDVQDARSLLAVRADQLDEVNRLLAERTKSLETVNRTLEEQMWLTNGEARLNDILRGEENLDTIAQKVINQICSYLEVEVGGLFILLDGSYHLMGRYAYPSDGEPLLRFAPGEGIIGQAAKEQRTLLINDIPEDSITISSGLGATSELDQFGELMAYVLATADYVHWLTADCDSCCTHGTATRSLYIGEAPKDGRLKVGGAESYRPVCPDCWNKLMKLRPSERRAELGVG